MGSDESHLNVSLTVGDKVTRQYPQTTTFEEKGEPKRIRTELPLLTSLKPYTARPNRLNPAVFVVFLAHVTHGLISPVPPYSPVLLLSSGRLGLRGLLKTVVWRTGLRVRVR